MCRCALAQSQKSIYRTFFLSVVNYFITSANDTKCDEPKKAE